MNSIGALQAQLEFVAKIANSTIAIPPGTVAAFDIPTGCPDGWIDFASAHGRTIVGASPLSGGTGGLVRRVFQEKGGTESVALTIAEMPEHDHEFRGKPIATYNGDPSKKSADKKHVSVGGLGLYGGYVPEGTIQLKGEGKEYNNMPPFVVLYFCKKVD